MSATISLRYFHLLLSLRQSVPVGQAVWTQRPIALVKAEGQNGLVGWGESAPLDGYGPDSIDQVLTAISNGDSTPSLDFGRECAVLSVEAQYRGETFADVLGPLKRRFVSVAHLSDPDDQFEQKGVVKVKVGRSSIEQDVRTVRRLIDQHPRIKIRLDANGASSHSDAMKLAESLMPFSTNIEFVEEPWESCFESDYRDDYPLTMAIDESMSRYDWRNADVCVFKPSLSGSLKAQLNLLRDISNTGRQLVLSSSWESVVGRTIVVLMASRFEGPAIGLGYADPFREDVHAISTALLNPQISVSEVSQTPGDLIRCDEAGVPIPNGATIRIEEVTP